MRVLITGGCGFIGSHLGKTLASRGHQVIAVDDFSAPGAARREAWVTHAGVEVIGSDAWLGLMGALARFGSVDAVVHLAALVSSKGDYWATWRNAESAVQVLNAVGERGIPTIYASTCKVYSAEGLNERGVREVDGPAHSWYGCSKYVGDLYAQEWLSRGLPVTIHRLSTVYGPGQDGSADGGWLAWFFKAKREGLDITIEGTGEQKRDILYVDDYVRLLEMCLEDPARWAGAYQIGGGPPALVSLNTVLEFLAKKPGPLSVRYEIHRRRHADFNVWVSDVREVSKRGWTAEVMPVVGLERLWETDGKGAAA